MEVAGLVIGAVSVVGLAGLYSTVLQAIDQIDAARHLERATSPILGRFLATKYRLHEWGEKNGIRDGKLVSPHHRIFDDDTGRRLVFFLLATIENIMADHKRLCDRYGISDISTSGGVVADVDEMRTEMSRLELTEPRKGWRLKARWAITDQKKFGGLVGEIEAIVEQFFKLVAPQASSDDLASKLDTLQGHLDATERREVIAWLKSVSTVDEYHDAIQPCPWDL